MHHLDLQLKNYGDHKIPSIFGSITGASGLFDVSYQLNRLRLLLPRV